VDVFCAAGRANAGLGRLSGGRERGSDRYDVTETVQDWAVPLNRPHQFLVAFRRFGSAQLHLNIDRIETRSDVGVETEEPAKVQVTGHSDVEFVNFQVELVGPYLESDHLAGAECGEQMLDGAGTEVCPSLRGGLINNEKGYPYRCSSL